jgi:AAA domain
MSVPEFSNGSGAYRLAWDSPELLTLEFERLDVTRREFTATIRATSTAPGASGLLHQERLNLESGISRDRFAVRLAKRSSGTGVDWDGLVRDACLKVLESYRAGDPAIFLRDVTAPPGAGWLLPPLALTRHPVIVYGDGGTLKSFLLLAAGIDIHSGSRLLGLESGARLRVGYLDAEFDGWEHRERMRRLVGDSMPEVVYIRSVGPLRDQIERLRRIIRDQELGFLLLDSIGFMCDGPPEEAQSALAFYDAVRQLNIGTLGAAHSNRTGDTEKPFGSVFWHNGARSTWYVKKQQEVGGDQVTIGLFNKKSNVGRLAPPLGYTFTFEGERILIDRTDVRDVRELAGQVALKDRMSHALRAGALAYTDLAEVLEADVESVSRIARRYEGKLFTLLPGSNGKKRVGLADFPRPDTVRPDTPDTVRSGLEGGRTDTPLPIGVSGPPVRPVATQEARQ